jgi:hexosaminidase
VPLIEQSPFFRTRGLAFAAIVTLLASTLPAQETQLVPFPKSCQPGNGRLVLNAECRIIATDESLLPLANLASEEMSLLFTAKCRVARDGGEPGAITLKIDKQFSAEAYQLEVTDRAVVKGGSYKGVVWGLVTLLQSATAKNGQIVVPQAIIADRPYAEYRGLLVDLARHWHPIETVKQAVVLAHWYKIGYLQLHLTDHESWTFPSTAYPKLATPGRHYTLEQLRDLESFAAARGVTIVPSLEMPGHAGILLRAMPTLVGDDPLVPATGAICPGRESTYKVADTLVGEVCDVFKSTPYYHIGGDEVDWSAWAHCKHCSDYRKQHGIENDEDLYRHFLVRMNEIVKKHGKQMIVWEGFKVGGKSTVPKDVIVMEFESYYELPQNYIAAGYKVINTAWQPLYVVNDRKWSPEKILSWNMYHWENWVSYSAAYGKGIDVPRTPLVLGAQMCAWEQEANIEIPTLRQRAAAMSERVWDHKTRRTFADFSTRLQSTDAKLTKLLPTTTPASRDAR